MGLMTWQERVLPSDADLYMAFLIKGENYARTARHYGADESSVRRRIRAFMARRGDESTLSPECPNRSDQSS